MISISPNSPESHTLQYSIYIYIFEKDSQLPTSGACGVYVKITSKSHETAASLITSSTLQQMLTSQGLAIAYKAPYLIPLVAA